MFATLPSFLLQAAHESSAHESGGGGDVFSHLLGHLSPHKVGEINGLAIFNLQIYQLASVLVTCILFGIVAHKMKSGQPLSGFWRILGGWVLWIREEMVFPILGHHHGKKLLPYFLSIFFFVMFCNLFGLLPAPIGGTATGSIFVTAALATTTFIAVLFLGMKEQGVFHFWQSLIPSGVPGYLVPLMAIVELIGLFAKHAALMLRLFVSMMAGHLILAIFLGFIFLFGKSLGLFGGMGVALPVVGVSALVMIIESFVSLLQAYIFTFLTIIFIGAAVHPDH